MSTVYPSQYKDQQAITIESSKLRIQFLPHIGSKMCSLIYKPLNREMLVQRPGIHYLLQPYDGDYVAGECSGFDEMFPTIDVCHYEAYPWRGVKVPDHGEVWALPWEHRVEKETLYFSTYGVRFPYKLEKWVSFTSEFVLRIDYVLTNLSIFDFDFLWSAHTMFNIEEGTELMLPTDVKRIVNVFSQNNALGRYGDEHAWPVITQKDTQKRDLRQLRSRDAKHSEKYYIKDKLTAGWCALKYHQSKLGLALSFPADTVPYLAILSNEGGWQNLYNIFLEPATATFDRPDAAKLHNQLSTVRAKSTYLWHLNLTLTDNTDFSSVNENGNLL